MSKHHRGGNWSSTEAAKWRKRIEATLPQPCVDCGRPVYPDQKWQVGHVIPLSDPNSPGNVAENLGPSHTKAPGQRACNQIAGGKLAHTNRQTREDRERFFRL